MPEGPGLSERERRYLMQCLLNAHHSRDHETLERLLRKLMALIPDAQSTHPRDVSNSH